MDKLIRLCLLLTFAASVVAMIAGIGHFGLASEGTAWCMAPIVAWTLTFITVALPFDRALDDHHAERNWQRATDLVRRAELSERFELRGWPPLLPGLIFVLLAFAIGLFAVRAGEWSAALVALVLALLGSPMFLRNIPHLNAPLLSCDVHGFRSGAYGEFSWHEIEGMSLQRFTSRSVTVYILTMLAPGVMQRLNRMHPCVRLLHRCMPKKRQDRLQFRLGMCGEAPQVVELVCFTLWERAVGAKPTWFPDDPDGGRELQELKQRLEEERRQIDAMAERELAKVGLSLAEVLRPREESKRAAPSFKDKLARSRPIDDGLKQRAIAQIPTYRAASVVCLLLIGGLLGCAFVALARASM
jgi:hypothetical protein